MEEEPAKKSSKCVYCGHYEGSYTKELHRFVRAKQGLCKQHDKLVNNGDTCECWKTAVGFISVRERFQEHCMKC